MAKKKATTRTTAVRKRAAKRELVEPRGRKRFVRRSPRGRFTESDDVGQSLNMDRRRKAKKTVKSGYGDKGDQRRRA
jgi:hypothetical protein